MPFYYINNLGLFTLEDCSAKKCDFDPIVIKRGIKIVRLNLIVFGFVLDREITHTLTCYADGSFKYFIFFGFLIHPVEFHFGVFIVPNPNLFPKQIMRTSSAPFGRGSKNQKFSFLSFRFSAEGVGGADKKWKGNFWFCFAASENIFE